MTAHAAAPSNSIIDGPSTTRQHCAGVLVITPKGPSLCDADTPNVLAESLAQVGSARGRVLLDMARVEYMSSAGISMLVQLREACVQAGGSLALCGLSRPIAAVLKTTRVDRLFQIAKTRDKALGKMGA